MDNATKDNVDMEGAYDTPKKEVSHHILGTDNPWFVGFELATAIDNAFVLGYPYLILVFLGWVGGSICLVGGGAVSLFANVLLARLAVIDGVRYYRFRDISRAVFGPIGYWGTVIMQWGNILAGNVGLIILAGEALQGVYAQYHDFNTGILLPIWIIFTGAFCLVVAVAVPDLHGVRFLSVVAGGCSVIFCFIALGISAHDGTNNHPAYNTGLGFSTTSTIFNAMGALGSIAFAYSTVIIPEIQATIQDPPVQNFYKAMIVNYGFGAPIFVVMTFVGFWAYGTGNPGVAYNLLNSLSGPKWAIVVAWVAVFVQSVISLQIYASPVYETIDTAFGRPGGHWTLHNIMVRMIFRIPYIALSAFIAALLPFFGDFIALIGALTVLPCNFVLTFMLTAQVNRHKHSAFITYSYWFLAFVFSIITGIAAIAAVRYIVVDSINYSVFANF